MSRRHESGNEVDISSLVDRAIKVWKKAQVIRTDPTFRGEPEPAFLSESLEKLGSRAEEPLTQLLYHEHPLVCAYALWTLFKVGSPVFDWLPDELMKRKERVTIRSGSFSTRNNLGGWAAHLRKRFRSGEPHSSEPNNG